jgi:argininosuccinate lyase
MKLWGGRFQKGPAELFERFSGSLDFDRRLLEADIVGSKAFASALERVGILTAEERGSIHAAFERILAESSEPDFLAGSTDEDIHTFVIRKLKETAGAVADKIHTGRSRNEQVATDFRLWLRKEIRAEQARLVDLMQALAEFAKREPGAILPGYTHLRRAQPVLWAHYLLAYFEMFSRDWERFEQTYQRTDVLPLGSGALAGSGLPFDREAMAKDLGFSRISANSLDMVSDRDFALDYLYAASLTMLHLSRLAEDWILYSSEEFGFLELGDEVTSGSSLMPQKKNPDAFELVRGKTGRVCGHLHGLMMTLKGLPLAYNRDLQEDKEPVFDAADHLAGSLEITRLCVETAKINAERMEAAAEESWTCATELAEALSRKGVPFHRAHQVVGALVLESVRSGKRPREWTAADLRAIAPEFDEESARLLAVRRAVENHTPPGGTAPATVSAALQQAEKRLAAMRARS